MLKVVIVDDEKMICSLISQLLDWEELGEMCIRDRCWDVHLMESAVRSTISVR